MTDAIDAHGLGQASGGGPVKAPVPHNLEAEQAVLGVLLYDPTPYERIGALKAGHFYEPFHSYLFEAIEVTIRKGMVPDPMVLKDACEQGPCSLAYEEAGGIRYLADLVDRAPPGASIATFAAAITDHHKRREVIRVAGDMDLDARSFDLERSADEIVEAAEQALYGVAEHATSQGGFITFSTALAGAVSMAAEAFNRDGGLSGLATDLIDIDRKVGGLHPSDLIILAGRPGMGKSALAANIGFNVAKNYAFEPQPDGTRKTVRGGVVGFFSAEMSAEQLALRILADVSGVSGDRIRRGEIQAHEFGLVREAAITIQESPFFIDGTGGISIAQLTARARRLKRQHGLDLIIVDYLQLVTCPGLGNGSNRVQEVSQVTMGLKALAKELACPVIALSQLSRKVEEREDKRPMLSDLRESGSIEQDADMVWFIFREAYYLGQSEPAPGGPEHLQWQEEMDRLQHLAEVIIAKQRHGPIGTVRLSFNADTTRFGNAAHDHYFHHASTSSNRGD